MPSMVTPTTIPIPFFSTGSQSTSGSGSFKRSGRGSRGTYSGRGRAPRGRRGKITSTTSCQTSPIPSYFWPDYQPSLISSGGSSANDALNLALMPRVFDHFPTSLPLNPLHYDFFTVLRAASPVVTFHCPSPLTQRSFSFVYSISFPCGLGSKPFLVAGINQQVLLLLYILSNIYSNLFQHFIISSYKVFVPISFSFRLFKEYEERYLFLFDLGIKPEGKTLRPSFSSERELSFLKEHFL